MFSHVILGVNNLDVSKKFYDAVLGALGVPAGIANKNRYFYRSPTGTFGITTPINGEPATHGNGNVQPAGTHGQRMGVTLRGRPGDAFEHRRTLAAVFGQHDDRQVVVAGFERIVLTPDVIAAVARQHLDHPGVLSLVTAALSNVVRVTSPNSWRIMWYQARVGSTSVAVHQKP